MIHVIATANIVAGRRSEFLAAFNAIVPEVMNESGCLEYGPTIDFDSGLERQNPVENDVVVILEKWESIEHLKAHLVAPHMTRYRTRVQEMVLSSNLRITIGA